MSGGYFDYKQFEINCIRESLKDIVDKNKVKIPKKELPFWIDTEVIEREPELGLYYNYSDEVIEHFKKAIVVLKEAYTYTHGIDRLLSGDTGEESFLEYLNEELRGEPEDE